jgi:hypothetical protein
MVDRREPLCSRRNSSGLRNQLRVIRPDIASKCFRAQRLVQMLLEKSSQLGAVGHGASLLGEVLQDDASVIGTPEKCMVDALSAPFDQRGRQPHQGNPKRSAQHHPNVWIRLKEPGKRASEQGYGDNRCHEKQNDEASLYEQVPRTPPQQHRNFHHAVFHYGIGERKGIQGQDNNQQRIEPERRTVSREVYCCAFDDNWQDAEHGAPKNHPRFAAHLGSGSTTECVSSQREETQPNEAVTPINQQCTEHFSGAFAHQLLRHPRYPHIANSQAGQHQGDTEGEACPFQPWKEALHWRARGKHRKKKCRKVSKAFRKRRRDTREQTSPARYS